MTKPFEEKSMEIWVTVTRSDEYMRRAAIESGGNVEKHVQVLVDVDKLSLKSRAAILATGGGRYMPNVNDIWVTKEFEIVEIGKGLPMPIEVDDMEPTAEMVDIAIMRMVNEFRESRMAFARKILEGEKDRVEEMTQKRDILANLLTIFSSESMFEAVAEAARRCGVSHKTMVRMIEDAAGDTEIFDEDFLN